MYVKKGKKREFHPRTGPKGPEREQMYSSTLFFNLGARWGWAVNARPWQLYRRERHGTHCIGG